MSTHRSLTDAIGYEFDDLELLERALAHRSWCAEHDNAESNERLEFLGDAVLGLVIADLAYRRFPDLPEGQLTNLRKAVVNAQALADVARSVSLGPHLKLGKGEHAANGRDKPSILSDALEAVIGAVYIDGGNQAAERVVGGMMSSRLDDAVDRLDSLDHKSRLQEEAAALGLGPPEYAVRFEGPDHAQQFFATAIIDGRILGEGEGRSKKAAERVAAAVACAVLSDEAERAASDVTADA